MKGSCRSCNVNAVAARDGPWCARSAIAVNAKDFALNGQLGRSGRGPRLEDFPPLWGIPQAAPPTGRKSAQIAPAGDGTPTAQHLCECIALDERRGGQ